VKIPNIGPRGQRRRLTFGGVSLGAAALLGPLLAAVAVTAIVFVI